MASNFAGTIQALVNHTATTDRENANYRQAIEKADGVALKKSIPDAVLALRADGFRTKGNFTKGERTEGSKVKRTRESLIQGFVELKGKGADSSGQKWWNRLRLVATDKRFKGFETREAFWTILAEHTDRKGNEAPVESMKALDRMLAGDPDLGARAEKQAGALVGTIGELTEAQVATFWETDNAKALKALIG